MTRTTFKDSQNAFAGSVLGYCGPWGKGNLVPGIDFTDQLTFDPSSPEADDLIQWDWGLADNGQVKSYDFVSYGAYDGGSAPVALAAAQLSAIGKIVSHYDVTLNPCIGEQSILTELYLYDTPGKTHMLEVGFMLSPAPSATAYAKAGKKLGNWTDPTSGRAWTAWLQKGGTSPYVMFLHIDGTPIFSTAINWQAALLWLVSIGQAQATWYFTGLAIGVEVISGSGSMLINSMSLEYA